MIPLFKVFMNTNHYHLNKTIDSGFITQGKMVEEFEKSLKELYNHEYLLTINSATSGLTLAIRLLNLKPEDVVLTTPLTCWATTCSILSNTQNFQWVDICPDTFTMDFDDLEKKLNEKVRVVVIVHWGGIPHNMKRLEHIKKLYNIKYKQELYIIEDCSHAFGSTYNNKLIGTFGNLSVFSFQAIKHLTTGDGGMILLPNKKMYDRAKLLRWYGMDRTSDNYRNDPNINEWGYKFHMNDLTASVGLDNLPCVMKNIEHSRKIAKIYDKELRNIPGITLLNCFEEDIKPSYWIYTLKVNNRDSFIRFLRFKKVEADLVHIRNDNINCVINKKEPLLNLDKVCLTYVCIPVGWWISEEIAYDIISYVKEWSSLTFKFRELAIEDYKEVMKIYKEGFPNFRVIEQEEFENRYTEIKNQGSFIFVLENLKGIMAIGKIVIEKKFTNALGHLEDIVVSKAYRRQGYGKILIQKLLQFAKRMNCYKVCFSADKVNKSFYDRCGFITDNFNGFIYL